jgi:hypothetical protein
MAALPICAASPLADLGAFPPFRGEEETRAKMKMFIAYAFYKRAIFGRI